ncbi:peptidylprolyl isomerase [Actinoplanes sp. CA-252034]|uniref:peptidylprolyl isomerase n=1 Tax=Actinoplanes sp. CA-252034 TaxID=3239906 RepID=UPI003D98F391
MASSKDRQRKLARAKFDRQSARRAERERRRRRVMAGVGATLAVLLIAAGGAWIGGAFDDEAGPTDPAALDQCLWTPLGVETNAELKDVGTPPTKDLPDSGTETMTITTDKGAPIVVDVDVTASTCAAASFSYLAGKKFFDNTECHELTTEGALRCGDPSGTGQGGPTYTYYDENPPLVPTPEPSASAAAPSVLYPKGTVAVLGNPKGVNGSQFLIFHKDFATADPQYSILGKVTGGLDTLAAIAKIETVENSAGDKVKPKDKITIKTLTIGTAATGTAPSAAASAAPSTGAQS